MITLAIDIGNTRIKAAVFNQHYLVEEIIISQTNDLEIFINNHKPQHAVMCAVGQGADEVAKFITQQNMPLLRVTYQTNFPFVVQYQTPETLGMDRLAGIAAAQHLYTTQNCLVIDAGTCITYDFISAIGNYQGGAISPGLTMRLKAMHEFTHKLPEPELTWPDDFEGKSTHHSLLSGVCFGVADEINGKITRYTQHYGHLQVLLCGGDAVMLAKHIKNNIFAAPSLVLMGLNQILLFNVNKG